MAHSVAKQRAKHRRDILLLDPFSEIKKSMFALLQRK
jgi:hypothetical protein